eukprot:GHVR01181929.1.p1 GENE.GHVR01181929.1~~GHVR01181929.1.p1  ORF type:complete len:233 (+),score=65.65 GHVR01181929.1:90-788(+)
MSYFLRRASTFFRVDAPNYFFRGYHSEEKTEETTTEAITKTNTHHTFNSLTKWKLRALFNSVDANDDGLINDIELLWVVGLLCPKDTDDFVFNAASHVYTTGVLSMVQESSLKSKKKIQKKQIIEKERRRETDTKILHETARQELNFSTFLNSVSSSEKLVEPLKYLFESFDRMSGRFGRADRGYASDMSRDIIDREDAVKILLEMKRQEPYEYTNTHTHTHTYIYRRKRHI